MNAILIISPEAWSAHSVSKHHYAMTLAARGHRVFFLDPPEPSFSSLNCTPVEGHPNLTRVRGPRVAPGLRFYPATLRRWLESRWLAELERQVGCAIDVIWLFENSRFYDLRFAGDRLKIYHQVDLNQIFHPAQAAGTADICFCTTELIRQALLPHNPQVFKLHHGLAQPVQPTALSAEQEARLAVAGPHVVYIGNLDMAYLDADLLATTACQFPAVRFHFVGGYRGDGALRQKANHLSNVVWWGKVTSDLIPAILDRADVLLVTYQAAHWQDQASPHKFMEYLDSGKVIVSTYTAEYEDKRDLLAMADLNGDFLAIMGQVIKQLPVYNSEAAQERRRAFAQDHTYIRQIARINEQLQALGLPVV